MNLVFVGASSLGLAVLEGISKVKGVKVAGVISAHEQFNISYSKSAVKNYLHADFQEYCRRSNVPLLFTSRGFSDVDMEVVFEQWKPDVFLVAGWYHMVPKSWLRRATFLGLHASLLPKYSGGAPLVWAMINGESEGGVTIFKMDEGVDSGPIAAQESFPIESHEDIEAVLGKATLSAVSLAQSTLLKLVIGDLEFRSQDELERTTFPQRSPRDGRIDPHLGADQLMRFIRAQTRPYPGAFFESKIGRLIVWKSQALQIRGEVMHTLGFVHEQEGLYFDTSTGERLEIVEYEFVPCFHGATTLDFIEAFNATIGFGNC